MKFRRLILLVVMLWSHPAFAQVDLMGSWRPLPRNQKLKPRKAGNSPQPRISRA